MSFENWTIEDLFTRCMDCDDMTLEMDKDEFAALRRKIAELRQAGNSPVWIGIDWAKGCEPANSQVIPDRWIPVSERMPPSYHEVLVGCWWGESPRWRSKWAAYIPGHPDAQQSGWLIPGASWVPTHWQELPAAPQEPKP